MNHYIFLGEWVEERVFWRHNEATYGRLIVPLVRVCYDVGRHLSSWTHRPLVHLMPFIIKTLLFNIMFRYSLLVVVTCFNNIIPSLMLLECLSTSCKGTCSCFAMASQITWSVAYWTSMGGFGLVYKSETSNTSNSTVTPSCSSVRMGEHSTGHYLDPHCQMMATLIIE